MPDCKVYVAGHGGLYLQAFSPSGTQGILNSLSVTLLVFSNVVTDCICSLLACRSIRQSNTVDRLLPFQKMTNILKQCPFGYSFPAGAKILYAAQPIRWQHRPVAHATPLLHLNARQKYNPAHNARAILASPTFCLCLSLLSSHVFSLLMCLRWYL